LVWSDVAGRRGRFEWHLLRHQSFDLKERAEKIAEKEEGGKGGRKRREKGGRSIFPTLIPAPGGEGI